uniref:Putative odorant binding protein 12 n=1 Tax=Conopomorpha sinensis TaxID=940481 RepID=A0A649ZUD0_9NEOP|nr:putative odorant binding protein 12 [Conopomorpha sinensis]
MSFTDEVGRIEQGKFIEDHRVMCYIACVYRTVLVVRDGRLDRRMINSEVDLLFPRNMRTAVKNAVADCAYLQDEYDDFCEAMFYVTKCIYETDPDNFVFP